MNTKSLFWRISGGMRTLFSKGKPALFRLLRFRSSRLASSCLCDNLPFVDQQRRTEAASFGIAWTNYFCSANIPQAMMDIFLLDGFRLHQVFPVVFIVSAVCSTLRPQARDVILSSVLHFKCGAYLFTTTQTTAERTFVSHWLLCWKQWKLLYRVSWGAEMCTPKRTLSYPNRESLEKLVQQKEKKVYVKFDNTALGSTAVMNCTWA